MKLALLITIAICVAAACAQVKQFSPAPPEPVTIHKCGPYVGDAGQIAAFAAAVIADGCPVQVARHPQDYGEGLWVVYGTRLVAGIEIEQLSK